MANINVSVINGSTVLSDNDVQKAVPGLQAQVHRDFAPAWGIDADLAFVPKGSQPKAGSWWLVVLDNSDQAGALGYHDLTSEGLPMGKVFAGSDLQNGLSWTVTASHELLEMLADPDINLTTFVQTSDTAGTLYAYEICDACESDSYAYKINNTLVSDFVYPSWFESFRAPGSTQFDFTKHISQPFQLLPGGYIGEFLVASGSGWTQKIAQGALPGYSMRAPAGSRRERRRTPRNLWQKSVLKPAKIDLSPVKQAIFDNLKPLKVRGVVSIRAGFLFKKNKITRKPAIVVAVDPKAKGVKLPKKAGGFPVDSRKASPAEVFAFQKPEDFAHLAKCNPELRTDILGEFAASTAGLGASSGKRQLTYSPPAGVSLAPVNDFFKITCHASPDAGWEQLENFFGGIKGNLTVGMYDFTSAHILQGLQNALGHSGQLTLTLDHPPLNASHDQSDEQTIQALQDALGANLNSAWALEDKDPLVNAWIFPNAYHIKVAVRDSSSFWLSSGNWNNSNQPDLSQIPWPGVFKGHDRDWHVIVEHAGLASTLEKYLLNDYRTAVGYQVDSAPAAGGAAETAMAKVLADQGAFRKNSVPFNPPRQQFPAQVIQDNMTIQPLLTPDPGDYQKAMLQLIQSAQKSIDIQLQYITPNAHPEDSAFMDLVNAVIQKISEGLEVRIILSEFQNVEALQSAGMDMSKVKLQNGVHNKGFIIDGSTVVLGSQNWSGDGVLFNRDASLIISHAGAAQYFQGIFEHDWDNVAVPSA